MIKDSYIHNNNDRDYKCPYEETKKLASKNHKETCEFLKNNDVKGMFPNMEEDDLNYVIKKSEELGLTEYLHIRNCICIILRAEGMSFKEISKVMNRSRNRAWQIVVKSEIILKRRTTLYKNEDNKFLQNYPDYIEKHSSSRSEL